MSNKTQSSKVGNQNGQTKRKRKKEGKFNVEVYDLKGEKVGGVELPKDIFDVEASPKLLAQYVRVYLANQRAGTASTKTRGEVRGSTRKIYRQKGTGRARHGDIRAPIFVGGGVVFGPKPRNFSLKINKKQKRKALFYSLTLKLKDKAIAAVEDEFLKKPKKTKEIYSFLEKVDLLKGRVVFVAPSQEKFLLDRVVRNIPKVDVVDAESLNAYEVLRAKKLLFVKKTFKILEQLYLSKNANK